MVEGDHGARLRYKIFSIFNWITLENLLTKGESFLFVPTRLVKSSHQLSSHCC